MYGRWKNIKQRTTNPKQTNYKNYGGRGIRMCDEWMDSFEEFYKYLGDPPTPRHTIDRINNDGNYEPGNVRWATAQQQAANKRPHSGLAIRIVERAKNKTGYAGVRHYFNDYAASIRYKGREHFLGIYASAEEAHRAYLKAAKELGIRIIFRDRK